MGFILCLRLPAAFQVLGEMGIVFFLFEMGLELSLSRLMAMKRDVFGLGLATFGVSAAAVAGVCYLAGLTGAQMVVIGGGVALSSSAFVLQLLRDRDDMGTRYGRACFGILLFQVGGRVRGPGRLGWGACLLRRWDDVNARTRYVMDQTRRVCLTFLLIALPVFGGWGVETVVTLPPRSEHPNVGDVSISGRNGAPSRRGDAWSVVE